MNPKIVATPFSQLLADLNGGVLEQQLAHVLSDVAQGVKDIGKTGKVVLTLDLKRIPNTGMVSVNHTMSFVAPTQTGKRSEEVSGETPLHVGTGGKISAFPEKQMDFLKSPEGQQA